MATCPKPLRILTSPPQCGSYTPTFFHTTPPAQFAPTPLSQISAPSACRNAGIAAPLVPVVCAVKTHALPAAVAWMEEVAVVYDVLAVQAGNVAASEVNCIFRLISPTSARSSIP